LLIAIDYDDVFTLDPALWLNFIQLCVDRDHIVICVTARGTEDAEEVYESMPSIVEDIIFTSGKQKRIFLEEHGYCPSVWIDDLR